MLCLLPSAAHGLYQVGLCDDLGTAEVARSNLRVNLHTRVRR